MITEKIGDFDVHSKGSLINTDKSLIQISLNSQFTFEFQFVKDVEKTDPRVEAYELGKLGIGFKFYNFNNVLGTGNLEPIRIGWLDRRSLYISYRIFAINEDEGAIVNYQFLLGKKVDADGNEI